MTTAAQNTTTPHTTGQSTTPQRSSAQGKHGGARVSVPPPLVYLALICAGAAASRLFAAVPLALPLAPWPGLLLGAALALAGVLLLLIARSGFVRTGQHPAPWQPSPELLLGGVYRYTRNPMYVGMTVFQLGLGCAFGNGWIMLFAPLALAIVHFTAVRQEEAYLSERFGEPYLRYTAAVRRYL